MKTGKTRWAERSHSAVFAAAVLLLSSACAASGADSTANVDPKAGAEDLVQAALLAEASGDRTARTDLLRQAIEKDPDSALAHWSAGEVRRDGRWVSLAEIQRVATADKTLAEYGKLREQHLGSVAGQVALARWCRDHSLPDESRVHWLQVLMVQPQHDEALKALGSQWYKGQLRTDAQVKAANSKQADGKQQKAARVQEECQWMERWTTTVAKWRRALKAEEASVRASIRREVAAATDPLAIQTLGTVLINGSRQKADPKGFRLLSFALIEALDVCDQPWVVTQLARHAVDHPTLGVRDVAADALKKRPKIAYVPALLSRMRVPIDARIVVISAGAEGTGARLLQIIEREEPNAIYRSVERKYVQNGTPQVTVNPKRKTVTNNFAEVRANSVRSAQNQAATLRASSDSLNTAIEQRNERIQYALSRATGEHLVADANYCKRWWAKYCCDYYEMEQTGPVKSMADAKARQYPYGDEQPPAESKPIIESYRSSGYAAPVVVTSSGSCFPWNTPVWTLTGPRNISQIQPGDRMLSQQPVTGELSYQAVLHVTRRKPSPMIEIGLGKETIRTTRGHPFWVCGEGWKMAKELRSGMWLHSVDGPVLIDRVDQSPPAQPWHEQPHAKPGEDLSYNLVLEQGHNYFVGQQKLLVHDNTLFPTDGAVPPVPGLAVRGQQGGQK